MMSAKDDCVKSGKRELKKDERKQRVKWSKKMSWALRHGLVKLKLDVRKDGYVRLAELLKKYNVLNKMSVEVARTIVKECPKQRFSIAFFDGEEYIRANQGHTVKGVVDDTKLLVPITLETAPKTCLHGTYRSAWERIQNLGLCRMKRNHIHFAKGLPGSKGVISGMRSTCEIFIYVDVARCLADGIKFYESANAVILSPGNDEGFIPAKYFSKVTTREGKVLLTAVEATASSAPEIPVAAAGGGGGTKESKENAEEETDDEVNNLLLSLTELQVRSLAKFTSDDIRKVGEAIASGSRRACGDGECH